jgi:hypothetical protein
MQVRKTEKQLRERKMLTILPLVVLPLLALVFHALGGGKGDPTGSVAEVKGLNMTLPDARFRAEKRGLDKMGAYGKADVDSAKLDQRRRQDPFYRDSTVRQSWALGKVGMDTGWVHKLAGPGFGGLGHSQTDQQADELLSKLDKLKEVLRHREDTTPSSLMGGRPSGVLSPTPSPALYRPAPSLGDPDIDKLNTLMDKVMKIQHPSEPSEDSIFRGPPELGQVIGVLTTAPVRTGADTGEVLGLKNMPGPGEVTRDEAEGLASGFIDMDDPVASDSMAETTVQASIARNQTLVSGASVELRLDQQAVIGGRVIPRGNSLWGKASLSGERLSVLVNSVRVGSEVFPVNLEVFDLDGMEGIRVDGSIDRDASKASADQALGTVGMTAMDPSMAGQATAAGIQAARSLLSRKIRLVRVTLKAGYKVLLKNSKTLKR